jgi:hypothetical protein
MSLAQRSNFELKSYAQIEHQCIIVSSLWGWGGGGGRANKTKEDQKAKILTHSKDIKIPFGS